MTDLIWTGGLEPELDLMMPTRPEDPEMRESASIWLFEENGAFAFPRIGIEAQGSLWDRHRYDMNFALGGGRVLRESRRDDTLPAVSPDGRADILGVGKLEFRSIEPFRKWSVRYEGTPYEGTIQEQIDRSFAQYADGDRSHGLEGRTQTPLSFEVELEMAAPAWTQDYRPEQLEGMTEQERIDAGLMGFGYRIEQFFRGQGTLTVDGESRPFRAVGTRVHRQSVRPLGEFRGHCWQGAVFPDGRAFGYIAYPPRADGTTYNEGFVYQDGRFEKAKATRIPFLRTVMPEGDDVSLELESAHGITRISGTTTLATFHLGNPGLKSMHNQQGATRYEWDGQVAFGMIERSSMAEDVRIAE